jgi:hypothetical protein
MSRNAFTKVEPTAASPSSVNCRVAEIVEIHISALSGGDSIAVSRSLNDEAAYVTWPLTDREGNTVSSSFTAPGIYFADGGAWLKFTKTGSAATTTIYVRQQIPG